MKRTYTDSFRIRINTSLCIYCGATAGSTEHFPPKSYGNQGFLFSACLECNSFAGTQHPLDLVSRIEYVKDRINARYAKYLSMPEWSDDELAELGGTLGQFVGDANTLRQLITSRVSFDSETYLGINGVDAARWESSLILLRNMSHM